MRAISDPSRLLGLDVARGLAVLGMFGAHLGAPDDLVLTDPASWGAIVHGRSSILFAVLAGVSIALLSGGRSRFEDREDVGAARARSRIRIVVRALLIFLIGAGLTALDTNILVILQYYALMFLLAVPMMRRRARSLFLLAGAWAIVSPVIVVLLGTVAEAYGGLEENLLVELLVTGGYPVIAWMSFLWFGMGIGRLDLTAPVVAVRLLGVGVGLAVVGYALGVATTDPSVPVVQASFGAEGVILEPDWSLLLGLEAHSGTTFEIVGSSGVAAAIIGSSLLVARPLRPVLFPIESVGATALSTYSLHVVAYALLFPDDDPTLSAWLWFAVTALVLCTLWRLLFGRGPLERLITAVSVRAAEGVGPRKVRAGPAD
ncbi:DUF1624 domain-containing protein [Labedella phragmitis]|uniref:DUF1624 domain-containing protein n=1 Tax=Labedella phragmitis TaxID=2498849 RepID=A0A444PXZ9_9MICO|nr:heparan-alpha-glucosaminide N-acetyltransferase domain-containing protein [Labedella phragmitis]RWZ52745.1 DUF1624 domain-containing protein [Labedella phragmitis]